MILPSESIEYLREAEKILVLVVGFSKKFGNYYWIIYIVKI